SATSTTPATPASEEKTVYVPRFYLLISLSLSHTHTHTYIHRQPSFMRRGGSRYFTSAQTHISPALSPAALFCMCLDPHPHGCLLNLSLEYQRLLLRLRRSP